METLPLRTKWWKFDAYEIKDGYILPKKGANLKEYDPFDVYESVWQRTKGKRKALGNHPPYIRLIQAISTKNQRKAQEKLLEWCSTFGLLGIMHFRATRIIYPCHCGDHDDFGSQTISLQPGRVNLAVISSIDPTDGRSCAIGIEPGLVVQDEAGFTYKLPVRTVLKQYFPEKTKELSCPRGVDVTSIDEPSQNPEDQLFTDLISSNGILSLKGKHSYAEPVKEFRECALMLKRTYDLLHSIKSLKITVDNISEKAPPDYALALRGCWQDLCADKGDIRTEWFFSSLLSALYQMMVIDIGGGKLMRQCAHKRCGMPFVADNPKQLYCRPQCKRAAEKARQRKKLLVERDS